MVFSSPFFLFAFFPIFLAAYFLLDRRFRNGVILLASLVFYAWGEPKFIFVVILSAIIDWVLGKIIARSRNISVRKWAVAVGILNNAGMLFYFKYLNFFIESANHVLHAFNLRTTAQLNILLPIGVSFIVFEKITYVVDIFRGTGKPADRFSSYLLYVLFFPKLLAGPIIKYHDIVEQIENREPSWRDFTYGVTRFCFGLAKKVLIADVLGGVVDSVFRMPAGDIGFEHAWLGLICFTLQIFFDFSGYSDIAIGMARILGFRLMENFNSPYISANFTEFWRRWHISLSTWIREYLYFPLGGNRLSAGRTYANLWICFLVSGLWHGAKWTFVFWGVYQGTFIALDKLFWIKYSKRLPALVNVGLCFFLVMLGWCLFRAETLPYAIAYLRTLFAIRAHSSQFLYVTSDIPILIIVGLTLSFLPGLAAYARIATRSEITGSMSSVVRLAFAGLLFVVAAGRVANSTFQPFLYFRF